MRQIFKVFFGVLIAAGLWTSAVFTMANSPYDQIDATQTVSFNINPGAIGSNYFTVLHFTVGSLPSSTNFSSITFNLRENLDVACNDTEYDLSIGGTTYAVHNARSGDFLTIPISKTGAQINSNGIIDLQIGAFASGLACINEHGYSDGTFTWHGSSNSSPYYGVDTTTGPYTPALWWNGLNNTPTTAHSSIGQASTSTPIVWQDPPFTDNFSSNDFNNWWNCVYIANGASGGTASYYIDVYYGTSTLTTYLDSPVTAATSTLSYIPVYKIPTNECPITPKQNALSPGAWQAQASLWRHSTFFGDTFVASSSILNFNISTGTTVSLPGQTPNMQGCGPTSFAVSFPNGGAVTAAIPNNDPLGYLYHSIFGNSTSSAYTVLDFGQGLCNLFVPQQQVFDQFGGLWDDIKVKPPMGYFTVSVSELTNVTTSTSATVALPAIDQLGIFKTAIDGALALLVGGSFLFWLFHRLRKFDFHH